MSWNARQKRSSVPEKIRCIRCDQVKIAADNFSANALKSFEKQARLAATKNAEEEAFVSCVGCTEDANGQGRHCNKCEKFKPLDSFARSQRRQGDLARCIECVKEDCESEPWLNGRALKDYRPESNEGSASDDGAISTAATTMSTTSEPDDNDTWQIVGRKGTQRTASSGHASGSAGNSSGGSRRGGNASRGNKWEKVRKFRTMKQLLEESDKADTSAPVEESQNTLASATAEESDETGYVPVEESENSNISAPAEESESSLTSMPVADSEVAIASIHVGDWEKVLASLPQPWPKSGNW